MQLSGDDYWSAAHQARVFFKRTAAIITGMHMHSDNTPLLKLGFYRAGPVGLDPHLVAKLDVIGDPRAYSQ